MRLFFRNQKGFIFVDALVGMVILSVALLALAVAYRQASISTVAASQYNDAVYLAQEAAEILKVNDGKKVGDPTIDWTLANKSIPVNNVMYLVDVQVVPDANSLQKATITVSWLKTKSISIVNYYYLSP